jgi:hypothetical protein
MSDAEPNWLDHLLKYIISTEIADLEIIYLYYDIFYQTNTPIPRTVENMPIFLSQPHRGLDEQGTT